ncbi:diaminopimelate decarboxylase [Phormidium sp. CLA17]|uniref:diaminopimelate decarboxylase n=1 Tax=Leptolyngbya sp. Cla-17 TaxID=2803751 RepID=UPI001491122C|nr:diaminopimelate decarboxylase [Leptolyngbya sp. Cla-17]MBM0740308.1 diaminopimelate decarboxylase [Leptolyngbya sp. Cla-17]
MVSTHRTETQSGRRYLSDSSTSLSPNQQVFPLTACVNQADHLEVGGCDVSDLLQQFGSPLYILDEQTLRTACQQYRDSFVKYYPGESQVIYASKAWNCLAVCAIVASEGLGIDVVSGGELYTALQAGVDSTKLYFHGNNKSRDELEFAAESGCTIVVDNWLELKTLAEISSERHSSSSALRTPHSVLPIQVMIRLTPGIECHTHDYIRTGSIDSKFGFDPNQLDQVFQFLSQHSELSCIGLHAHIGSQIFELEPHHDLAAVMVQWLLKATHHGLPIEILNIGGGLGICYTESDDPPSIEAWVKTVSEAIAQACDAHQVPYPKLISEPGRSLIGSACVTAYTIGGQKVIPNVRTYWSVDGGMSDNPRPITYQSVYRAVIANQMSAPLTETITIAGKHCESGDVLIKDAKLATASPGDALVIPATGAYNYSMSSNYNRIPRPAAVLVNSGEANLILQRETYDDLIRQDCLPERLRQRAIES